MSLTFDAWTSKIMTSYIAITVHWITQEWVLRSELLQFSEIHGSHSGENLGKEIYNATSKFGINAKVSFITKCVPKPLIQSNSKIRAITSDNVMVNDKAGQQFSKKPGVDFNPVGDRGQYIYQNNETNPHSY